MALLNLIDMLSLIHEAICTLASGGHYGDLRPFLSGGTTNMFSRNLPSAAQRITHIISENSGYGIHSHVIYPE